MAVLIINLTWVFVFGLLGNIISFMVYLSPLPTFCKIYKRKSTEGFQAVPYVVALFSAMLWIYYALLKQGANLLITVNSVGCLIELIYISMYLFYAPKKAKIAAMKLLLLLNFGAFGLILVVTTFLANGSKRVKILGWFCVAFSASVFAAPLCVIRQVIRTKSVEFMPFPLSFCLTLCAVVWFFYGLLLKDTCIALPNVLGFGFGIAQMVVYAVYRNSNRRDAGDNIQEQNKVSELSEQIIEVVKLNTVVCKEMDIIAAAAVVAAPQLIAAVAAPQLIINQNYKDSELLHEAAEQRDQICLEASINNV
ncbi:bidirectional sugar transporter SWEET14-like [Malania oleifera]|uniref:bidirectional sugar transporter SWEET14-like n=1 Tax=Malania oleifera TaxID=397392 RepID=UPI0025AEAB70|nr:bidirectional sugar transporter SWEET14-like [Malania oleifera]